jgi:hypothetical protein
MAKQWRAAAFGRAAALAPVLAVLVVLAGTASAAVTRWFWSDPATGFAIGGFDPVAYFVDAAPRQGRGGHEFEWQGAIFNFVSAANLAVFAADPEVYAPQFGGHDAMRAAKGIAAEGNPHIWMVAGDRLYFFATEENRAAWTSVGDSARGLAQKDWKGVR